MGAASAGLPVNPGAGTETLAGYSAGMGSVGISAPLSTGASYEQPGTIITVTTRISPATASSRYLLFLWFMVPPPRSFVYPFSCYVVSNRNRHSLSIDKRKTCDFLIKDFLLQDIIIIKVVTYV
jgi:hypothetical protein